MNKTITTKDGKRFTARKIKGSDYDDVMDFLDLFSRGKEAHWTNQYPGQPKRNKESCVKLYDSPDAYFLGVWNKKKLIGFGSIILGRRNHPRNALAGDFGITILENYTSCGLGTFIMKKLIKWSKKEKVHRIQGMVFHENIKALGLYQKLGFEIEGMAREIAKYHNKWQHGYYIAKILD